jgi:anti-anti-sigma factor
LRAVRRADCSTRGDCGDARIASRSSLTRMTMKITQREVKGVAILDLEGRLVMEDGVPALIEHLNALIRQSRRRIILNFDKVTYLDSAGVGAVAWKFATARRRDVDVKLMNLRRKSHNVLKTTKLLTVLKAYESEQEALDSFVDDDDDDLNPIFT